MYGHEINYSTAWAEIGNAVGYSEDFDDESLLDYLNAVLLEDSPSIRLYPAAVKSKHDQQVEDSCWHTLTLLTLAREPLTVSGLGAMQHTPLPIVRDGIAALERLGLVMLARRSRLVFRIPLGRQSVSSA